MPLSDQHRQKLDSIVQQMVANQESDDNIQLVVNDFKQKYDASGSLALPPAPKVTVPGLNAPSEADSAIEALPMPAKAMAKGMKWLAEGPAEGIPKVVNNYNKAFGRGPESVDERLGAIGSVVSGAMDTARPAAALIPGQLLKEPAKTAAELLVGYFAPEIVGKAAKKAGAGPGAVQLTETVTGALPFVSMANRAMKKPTVVPSEPVPKGIAKSAEESAKVFESIPEGPTSETNKWAVGKKAERQYVEPKRLKLPWIREEVKPAAEAAERLAQKRPDTELAGKPRDVRRAASMPPEEGVPEPLERLSDELARKPYAELTADEKLVVDDFYKQQRRETQRGGFAAEGKPLAEKPVEEKYFNFDRVKVSPQEESMLRQRLRDMDAAGEIAKDVESHAAIIAEAKAIDPRLVREVSNESGIRGRAARQVMRERINALARELTSIDESLKGKTPEEASTIESQRQRMETDLNSYLKEFAGIRTEAGRNLAALKIMARNTLDIEWWMNEAKRSAKIPKGADLPEDKAKKIRGLVIKSQDEQKGGIIDGPAKKELIDTVAKLRENGWMDTAVTLWRTGLLTGPKTHARNILGNVGFAAMEEASRAPAWMVDLAWSLKSGKRTVAAPNPIAVYRAMADAATNGVDEARQIMTRGASKADLAKGELQGEWNFQGLRKLAEKTDNDLAQKVLGTTNDLVNKYINTVGRALGAEDKIFKVYAIRRGIEAQARIKAMSEMKAGVIPERDLVRRTRALVQNPTEAMTAEAIAYADFATFNNENVAANAVGRFASTFGPIGKAVVNTALPFRRTPFNIFNRMMDYTPIGAAARPALEFYSAKTKGKPAPDMQRVVSEAVGRGMTGTALLALGWKLGMEGKATGTAQEDPSKLKVQRAAGRNPGSVQIAGDWYKTAGLAPGGALIQIGAQLAREQSRYMKNEDPVERSVKTIKVGTRTLLEQPMMQASRELVESLENPDSRWQYGLASRAGSMVPSVINDIATLTNPQPAEFRPAEDSGLIGAAAHGVKSRLPFLRGTLPPATDAFGDMVEGRATNAFNPFTPTKAKETTDSIYRELINLDIGFSGPKPMPNESDTEFRERKILAGAVAKDAVRKAMEEAPEDKDERREFLRKAITRAESALTRYIKEDEFQSMTPQQRIQEMRELTATYR